mmetsp:Transcript_33536/g.107150  ORF Transcript_33536/g.107150 Transcript_33536/m.107150 type:complete len:226 (+) Transcript_33536:649-1326(+)
MPAKAKVPETAVQGFLSAAGWSRVTLSSGGGGKGAGNARTSVATSCTLAVPRTARTAVFRGGGPGDRAVPPRRGDFFFLPPSASARDDDDEDEEGSSSDSGGGPMYGDSSPVVSLTSDTFEAETKDKDAFLEFYAPWCGHCQQLKPTYTSLAEKLKPYSENVIVAAMDATAHDPPAGFDVAGYPTILFKPKGADPIPYEDDRHVDAMLEFATKHASFALPSKDEL